MPPTPPPTPPAAPRRRKVDEMEASAKRLKDRCAALLAGAKKYRDGINTMLDAQNAFAAALSGFGGGSDEESLHLGARSGGGGDSCGGPVGALQRRGSPPAGTVARGAWWAPLPSSQRRPLPRRTAQAPP
jgi:hypothetical protein